MHIDPHSQPSEEAPAPTDLAPVANKRKKNNSFIYSFRTDYGEHKTFKCILNIVWNNFVSDFLIYCFVLIDSGYSTLVFSSLTLPYNPIECLQFLVGITDFHTLDLLFIDHVQYIILIFGFDTFNLLFSENLQFLVFPFRFLYFEFTIYRSPSVFSFALWF